MTKKLILAILSGDAVEPVMRALVEQHYAVTQIGSVGGFLRRGSATLVVGVDESKATDAIDTIRGACGHLTKPDGHAATIFVVNAAQFVQF